MIAKKFKFSVAVLILFDLTHTYAMDPSDAAAQKLYSLSRTLLNHPSYSELAAFFITSASNLEIVNELNSRQYLTFKIAIRGIKSVEGDNNTIKINAHIVQEYYSKSRIVSTTSKSFLMSYVSDEWLIKETNLTDGMPILLLLLIIAMSICLALIPIFLLLKLSKKSKTWQDIKRVIRKNRIREYT